MQQARYATQTGHQVTLTLAEEDARHVQAALDVAIAAFDAQAHSARSFAQGASVSRSERVESMAVARLAGLRCDRAQFVQVALAAALRQR